MTVGRGPLYCRVHGLTSDAGKAINGLCGRVLTPPSGVEGDPDRRVPVALDGVLGTKSLKLGNIHVLPQRRAWIAVGVGREELNNHGTDPARPTELFFSLFDKVSGQRIAVEDVPGEAVAACGRSVGNVLAVSFFLDRLEQQGVALSQLPVHFMLTDLNVCRIINLIGCGAAAGSAAPHECLAQPLEDLHRCLQRVLDAGGSVFATFDPHRCVPDEPGESTGTERVNAVLEGCAVLYPSPQPQRVGCIESRFVGLSENGSDRVLTSRNERFIDYGPQEALTYVVSAASVGDSLRLMPRRLAAVDPQAFWAACMRVDAFLGALSTADGVSADIVTAWMPLAAGMHACVAACCATYGKFVPWDALGTWQQRLTNAEQHKEIAQDGALTGLLVSLDRAKSNSRTHPHKQMCYQVLDDMRDTQVGKIVSALMSAGGDHHALNRALESEGFGQDALGLAEDPLRSCGACGKTEGKLLKCVRCEGQVYCSSDCQKKAWPQHKKCCFRAVACLRKKFGDMEARGFQTPGTVSVAGNVHISDVPQCVIIETSGVGRMTIMWNPGKLSFVTHAKHDDEDASNAGNLELMTQVHMPSTGPEILKMVLDRNDPDGAKRISMFSQREDLPQTLQFLLSCGPLQDMELAKRTLASLVSMPSQASSPSAGPAGPMQAEADLRVPSLGLTALEWAAKKGNIDVVEWLCTDERTRFLVNTGSPIGWACYVGRVECAKALLRHGADPTATDAVLWGGVKPLLAAAQNGQLEALKWLVGEAGVDLRVTDHQGRGAVHHVKMAARWQDMPDHVECLAWITKNLQ